MSYKTPISAGDGLYGQMSKPDPFYVNIETQLVHLIHLMNMQAITPQDYRTLYKQLHSPDKENHVVAEQCILEIIRNL